MRKKIAFFIGGTGLGNATRSIPVIESAVAGGWDVSVATSSLSFDLIQDQFKSRIHLTRLERQRLAGQSELNMLKLILRLPELIKCFARNFLTIRTLLRQTGTQLVFVDSEYSGLFAANFRGCHIAILNQGILVKRQWQQAQARDKRRLRFSFYFLEYLEDLLYRTLGDIILVPSPCGEYSLPAPYQLISPPTRFKKLNAGGDPHVDYDPIDVLYIAGGSGMVDISHLEKLVHVQPPIQIVVIGKVDQTLVAPNVQFHGVVSNSEQYIENARYVVSQGGYSSLMDLIFLGKPALLLPIAGHAEQHMNALWAEQQGFAVICRRGDSVEQKFNDYRDSHSRLRSKIEKFKFGDQGGREALRAAELIELNRD